MFSQAGTPLLQGVSLVVPCATAAGYRVPFMARLSEDCPHCAGNRSRQAATTGREIGEFIPSETNMSSGRKFFFFSLCSWPLWLFAPFSSVI
ncbi:hypothetical protein BC835DRAFT_1360233 [Cytidiella melzeri]|nr:hypothetical protein BC835DRAFT_1360233 [Cytidiella melzeri]